MKTKSVEKLIKLQLEGTVDTMLNLLTPSGMSAEAINELWQESQIGEQFNLLYFISLLDADDKEVLIKRISE